MGYLEEAENHWLVHIRITAQNIQKALEHNGILKNGVSLDILWWLRLSMSIPIPWKEKVDCRENNDPLIAPIPLPVSNFYPIELCFVLSNTASHSKRSTFWWTWSLRRQHVCVRWDHTIRSEALEETLYLDQLQLVRCVHWVLLGGIEEATRSSRWLLLNPVPALLRSLMLTPRVYPFTTASTPYFGHRNCTKRRMRKEMITNTNRQNSLYRFPQRVSTYCNEREQIHIWEQRASAIPHDGSFHVSATHLHWYTHSHTTCWDTVTCGCADAPSCVSSNRLTWSTRRNSLPLCIWMAFHPCGFVYALSDCCDWRTNTCNSGMDTSAASHRCVYECGLPKYSSSPRRICNPRRDTCTASRPCGCGCGSSCHSFGWWSSCSRDRCSGISSERLLGDGLHSSCCCHHMYKRAPFLHKYTSSAPEHSGHTQRRKAGPTPMRGA